MEDSHSLPHSQPQPPDNAVGCAASAATAHVADGGVGSITGAKYRLMSPAKLPISRSACINIPPGLSPTSFLESPVLLSNIKAEPSPTTGSFFKPQVMQGSTESTAIPLKNSFPSSNNIDERTSSSFEFRFRTGASSTSGLPSVALSAEPSPTTGSFFKPQVMQGSTESTAIPLKNSFPSSNNIDERTSSSFEFRFRTGASSTSGLPSVALSVPIRLNRNGPATHKDQYLQSSAPSSLAIQTYQPGNDTSVCKPADEFNQEGLPYTGIQASSPDHKDSISAVSTDRTSEDGYNWRKYGQKLVKGSEFPRSYYKCTYPNCEVKKIFERSPSGHITEIVYKGSHGHPKPQTARRHNPGALMTIQEDKLDKDLQFTGQEDKFNTNTMEQNGSPVLSPLQGNQDGLDGSASQYQGTNEDVEEDDHFLKRRKMEDSMDVMPVVKPIREPRVVVQTVSEVDILDDGYRWRKYGQKVVRGNPNPRSYYKCTNSGCPVRKHVERASHDPKAVITTYEGKHNHDVPTARNSSHELAGAAPYGLKVRQQDGSSVSLDLGVGIGRGRTSEPVQVRETDPARSQTVPYNSGMMAVQTSQVPPSYGIVNSGLNLYENRENRVEGHSFQTPPVHPSNTCPPNIGRILMGP